MKLMISKSKDGKSYYSKITNDYNGKHTEKYLSLQIPKQNNLDFGLYEVDGFISCYEKKDGTTEFKFVVTNAVPTTKYEKKQKLPTNQKGNEITQSDPFTEFGEEIDIEDNMLD